MTKKTPDNQDLQYSMKHALETLRNRVVDLEATAHAAEELLQYLPYVPRSSRRPPELDAEARLNLGRLQSLVVATAAEARSMLKEVEELIERAYQHPRSDSGSSKAGEAWNPRLARPWDAPSDLAAVVPVSARRTA